MRGINQRFIEDLQTGSLSWCLGKVRENAELRLEIRENYINIYYKGGSALRITQKATGYSFEFDPKYCLNESLRAKVSVVKTSEDYLINFELLLSEMDSWFLTHQKEERRIQHDLLIHSSNEFRILDVEYAGSYSISGIRKGFRLDMIAVANGKLVVVENKNGEKAMGGSASLIKHYNDICAILDFEDARFSLVKSMKNIAANKKELGLPTADFSGDEIEILFVVFNRNSKSKMLDNQRAGIVKKHPAKIIFLKPNENAIRYETAEVFV